MAGASLLDGLIELLLPEVGTGVITQQVLQGMCAGVLLRRDFSHVVLHSVPLFEAIGLLVGFAFDLLAAIRVFCLFFAQLLALGKAFGNVLIEAHKAGGAVVAQSSKHLSRQQAAKRCQFLVKALGVRLEV